MGFGIYPWGHGIDPHCMDDETQLTLEEQRLESLKDLSYNYKYESNNMFGLIETYCIDKFGKINILKLISIKNLEHDRLIFYCLDDIKNGYYKDTNKIDLAITLYKKREEFLNRLIGIKGGNEIVPNLLYNIKESRDKEIFDKSLDFLINYYMDILDLKPYVGRY